MTTTAGADPATEQAPDLQLESSGLESAAGTAAAERRFPCLDGYRALAALAVLTTHVAFYTGAAQNGHGTSWLSRLDIGVPVFFGLSGFLLYRPMLRAEVDRRKRPLYGPYLLRRMQRLLPAYWVSVAATFLLVSADTRGLHSPTEWLRQLFLVWPYQSGHKFRALDQNWSLSAEFLFYLLLPFWPRLLAPIRRRVTRWWRVDLTAAGLLAAATLGWTVIWHQTSVVNSGIAGYWLISHLDWFAAGLALAVLQVLSSTDGPRPAWMADIEQIADAPATCWAAAAAIFALAVTPVAGPWGYAPATTWETVTKEFLYAVFAAVVLLPGVIGDQDRGWPRTILKTRVLQRIGVASYGLFLLHQTVIEMIYRVWGIPLFSGRFPQLWGLTVGFGLIAAFASLYLVELPALRLRRRLTRGTAAAG